MSTNELPADGDWEAVETAIHLRMRKLGWSIARLSRESGISEPTIRYIGQQPETKRQRPTLVALSAALGCPYTYLVDVLRGEADPDVPPPSPAEAAFFNGLLQAEIGPLKAKMDVINDKVDELLARQRKDEQAPRQRP